MEQFYEDVIRGLKAKPKQLQSKYFYNAEGDRLFQQIMQSPEYYVTDCELEIFKTRCKEIAGILRRFEKGFDVVELGAGDAYKSSYLLDCLLQERMEFTYYPTDISEHAVELVEQRLPEKLPGLKIKGLVGEFFQALNEAQRISARPKVVLFLGSNIGNMPAEEAKNFCRDLRTHLNKGDLALIGFDLKKNPWVIFHAYNDASGATKAFNLNLLQRINEELGADFALSQFDHYEFYDPESGACKSYLISLADQTVNIRGEEISFQKNEYIFMETSQKYTAEETIRMAEDADFLPLAQLFDSKKWFTDVIWECV